MTRTFLALLLAVSGVAGTNGAAAASVRYVSPDGSDGASGSAAHPWKTLQHAVDAIEIGGTVLVLPGTYAGMRIDRSGQPDAWITIAAETPGTVTIDRPGPGNKHSSNVEIENWEGDGTVSYWIVEGLEVTGAPNWGIDTRGNEDDHSHHITIRDNEVHHNGVGSIKTGIFFAFTDHGKIVGNNSHHNGEHGIYISNSSDHFVVRRNHLHHNRRCGLHMNGDLSQGGDGIISDVVVDSNRINDNGVEGCAGVNMDGVTNSVITNNVIVENHASGITLFNEDGAVCSRRNQVLNNTIVQAEDGRWAIVIGGTACRDNTILNNVMLTRHAFRGVIEAPDASVPGLVSDYNLVADRFTVDEGDHVITLAQWRSATGQDQHSSVTTIGAVFTAGGYRHEPGGVAEDAGTDVDVAHDFDGVHRPAGGALDVGAYETPYCSGAMATIVGTRSGDHLTGGADGDVIAGLAGRDDISGKGGPDTICGGSGKDDLSGGARGDTILGGKGGDHLSGDTGRDALRGNGGVDTADGGPGVDSCKGETLIHCE
jgi:parallel beta-helix repeat protein